jgi:hypothetical protein
MSFSAKPRCRRLLPLLSLIFLFTIVSVMTSAAASDEEIRVLANIPLNDMRVDQMIQQQWEGKTYLYLHRPAEDTYALVDVSNTNKPVLVSGSAMKGSAPEGPAGNSPLAITSTREGDKPTAALVTQTVNFMDMSNPKAIKPIKTFKGVTSMFSDDARKLVYLVNGEGLWVVKHRNTNVPLCGGGGVNDCLYPGP